MDLLLNVDINDGAAASMYLSGDGNNRIETSALPKGIYVLKVGENTAKIVK